MNQEIEIDRDVRDFIFAKIASFEHLEILLWIYSQADQAWEVSQVSQALRSSDLPVACRLADLERDGLLISSCIGSEVKYRFNPDDSNLRNLVDKLSKIYAEHRAAVVQLIFSKPKKNIQGFADAFKVRKD